jgi:hypothetical protein
VGGAFIADSDTITTDVSEELGEGGIWVVPQMIEDALRFEFDWREEGRVTWGDEGEEWGSVGAS